jgi:hypothetical protein
MKFKVLLIFSIIFLFSKFTFGQTEQHIIMPEKVTLENVEARVIGTYEVIKIRNKKQTLFSKQALLEIEKRRDDNKEVYYEVGPGLTIKILPRSVINAPGFIPIINEQE